MLPLLRASLSKGVSSGVYTISLTIADVGNASTSPSSESTASSTMGLGVSIDLGDIKPFISYGTYSADGSQSKDGIAYSGSELGLTYALGADTVVVYIGNTETTATADGTAGKPLAVSGMEVGYNTTLDCSN